MDRKNNYFPYSELITNTQSLSHRARRAMQPNGVERHSFPMEEDDNTPERAQESGSSEPLAGLFRGPKLSDRLR